MKETRQYGLFEKQHGKWVRLYPSFSAKKSGAVHIFQNLLLGGVLEGKERSLRPIKVEDKDCSMYG